MLFQATAVVIVKCVAKGPEKLMNKMEGSGMKYKQMKTSLPPSLHPSIVSQGDSYTLMICASHTALLNITVITNSFLCPLLSSAAGLQTFVMEILLNRVDSLTIYSVLSSLNF